LPTAKTEAPHSLLWLAAIQIVERKQNLPDLAKALLHSGSSDQARNRKPGMAAFENCRLASD